MAASPAMPIPQTVPTAPASHASRESQVVRTPMHMMQTGAGIRSVRRRITPREGFALEVLGHAIEYLADEYAAEAGAVSAMEFHDPRVEAMQLLMAANRKVYTSCPVIPSFGERLRRYVLRVAR